MFAHKRGTGMGKTCSVSFVVVVAAAVAVAFAGLKLLVELVVFATNRFAVADVGLLQLLQQLLMHTCFVVVVVNNVGDGYGCCYGGDDGDCCYCC